MIGGCKLLVENPHFLTCLRRLKVSFATIFGFRRLKVSFATIFDFRRLKVSFATIFDQK
jgi:hypothetical protein